MNNEDKPRLFPEHFKIGVYSGSPRDFTKGKISFPRGGEDLLEYWYSEDPEESEYLDEDFQENVELKIKTLKEQGWDPSTQIFYATTNSHLDLGWMWRFRQGVGKAERTFKKIHEHFKLFAPFTFSNSQPAQYQWIKFNSPDIWKTTLIDVKSGRHELQGGSWSEADGRMPSGEAWVRQRLYGQLFYARNFGKIANIAWFPDSFGYANNLPQIFAKSGAEGFMSTKLINNKQTKWPFWAWIWEAPDGSSLISYLCGNHSKLGPLGGFDVSQAYTDIRESYVKSYRLLKPGAKLIINYELDQPESDPNVSEDEIPFIGCFFGEGDGGHGPQGVEVAVYRAFAERGFVKWMSTKEIYQELEKFRDRLPVWKDELYYQFHRGSLTTQTAMKRMNRFFEWNLPIIEGLHAIVTSIKPNTLDSFKTFYTNDKDEIPTTDNPIEQIWQNILLMQFHDVFPGTSIPEVYDECYEFWHQDKLLIERLRKEAMEGLSSVLNLDNINIERFSIGEISENLVILPILIANMTGANGIQIIEIPIEKLGNTTPLVALINQNKNVLINGNQSVDTLFKPIQLIKADNFGFDLDRKKERYIFENDLSSWTCEINWLVCLPKKIENLNEDDLFQKIYQELNQYLLNSNTYEKYSIKTTGNKISLISPELILSINQDTGLLDSIKYKEFQYLKNPAGLKSYIDKPLGEHCWNLMPQWWEHPIDDFSKKPIIKIIEQGPIQWTVRVSRPFGENSQVFIDYSLIADKKGFGINIGIDFHDIEKVIKYQFPFSLNAEYTIAETNYATSTRKNNPTANHDVPRWEKWMHTFVALENEEKSNGIAIINESKYGFDTFDDSLSITILHGPRYPGSNPVAWVRDERKAREKANLGQVPEYADQGEHLTRLWVLPYLGSWKDASIHQTAHVFNAPASTLVWDSSKKPNENQKNIRTSNELSDNLMSEEFQWQFLHASPSSVEISVLKQAEILPKCLVSDPPTAGEGQGLVFRVVNNIDIPNEAEISINKNIFTSITQIIELDLLERPLKDGLKIQIEKIGNNKIEYSVPLKPHEIRTFKAISS
jgi:alpha-mannosidase